ncbi:hypothetical protein LTR36_006430 [Oleoguttula mirabilis]|uniref:Carboxypeptidase n=1 Tax=Oleoguttula mirabilis TaxID=1507867 RepID=A0AAV9JXR2_9PEZI|nr:hypothetical protein LTR36_006430 [Oleoguttula mirabilis]
MPFATLLPLLAASFVYGLALPAERPLHQALLDSSSHSFGHGSGFPVFQQDDDTCKTNTTHFTGKVQVSAGKSLFFWFVESVDDAQNKPTVVWLNGGPGASSMVGLFEEIGPCEFLNANKTIENPHTWANFANLLFLDQPAGVGFSTVVAGETSPVTLGEASVDFAAFLHSFVSQFPEYFTGGLYIAGESFGGRYTPRFTADILRKQIARAADALPVRIMGIALFNALVDGMYTTLGHYEMFCTDQADLLRFNETVCTAMAAAIPEAERLQRLCQATYDSYICAAAQSYGQVNLYKYFQEEVDALRRSPYDLRLSCDRPPICIPSTEFSVESYLSAPEIQSRLGIGAYLKYLSINFALNTQWSAQPEISLPSTSEVSYLLDEGKIAVLAVNGNYDVSITSTGAWREYDELPWSGSMPYRLSPRRDWYFAEAKNGGELRKGGQTKAYGRLKLAGVDDAGHMSPGDQKEGVASLARAWIAEVAGAAARESLIPVEV